MLRLRALASVLASVALGALAFGMSASAAAAGKGGCPGVNGIVNKQTSLIVGARFTDDGLGTATYYFSSADQQPVNGVPGLIKYCVYPVPAAGPDAATAVVDGTNGDAWVASFPTAQGHFAFGRLDGDPSNVPLDGTTDVEIGTAQWTSSNGGQVPHPETILLHINDAAECAKLYGTGGDPDSDDPSNTCFVFPGLQPSPPPQLCNGAAACKQVIIDEAITSTPLTAPAFTQLHIHYTYVIVNQPGNTYNMIFYPPLPSTKDINTGGAKDYFGCEQVVDPAGAPGSLGKYLNYQGTGLTMNLTNNSGASCQQVQFTMTAPSSGPVVLTRRYDQEVCK